MKNLLRSPPNRILHRELVLSAAGACMRGRSCMASQRSYYPSGIVQLQYEQHKYHNELDASALQVSSNAATSITTTTKQKHHLITRIQQEQANTNKNGTEVVVQTKQILGAAAPRGCLFFCNDGDAPPLPPGLDDNGILLLVQASWKQAHDPESHHPNVRLGQHNWDDGFIIKDNNWWVVPTTTRTTTTKTTQQQH